MANNWELIHEIETTLNTFLEHQYVFSSKTKDDSERLGKSGVDKLIGSTRKVLQFV